MLLYKIEDFNPSYREVAFDGEDIKGFDVCAGNTDEKIGTLHTVLVDETGRFRYFVADTGVWIFGKKVLVPVGLCRVDFNTKRVYARSLQKQQVENLVRYENGMVVDYDYEEQVRKIYRTPTVGASAPVEASLPLEASRIVTPPAPVSVPAPYTYEREPELYQMNEQENQKIRLYEERLIADKIRQKTGEVVINKRVETETAKVSVPVAKERAVIEHVTPENAGTPVSPEAAFGQQETVHMELHEETADIKKQAFVREEVKIRKEVEKDTVDSTETLRSEKLDLSAEDR
ncbi:DUF2382 domain-containing protein [Tychonema sp. LEGE 07203]|uniref:DUF2382 domain-containing protein n=1 Tax=Tychonema sp. LEGE 07203 TaxID=1828671 RepID=UPI00187F9DC4|nr:DUF2382 domain-containing protein [Tychonema sp. LEGE 07203]MBE9096551.1 DUF2382 domain-containing protein [Tychonema sp. LEGE 07203]